jgi:PKD repeat protein
VASSEEPVLTHAFAVAGEYEVTLTAANCRGADTATATLEVWEELMVPAVVHAPGLNGTRWRSDLRLYNPGAEGVAARVEVRPRQEPQSVVGVDLQLGAHATLVLDDVAAVLGDLQQGSVRVRFPDAEGATTPVGVSRTTNDADAGTFGQYIPAVRALSPAGGVTLLTGLAHDDAYRTNLLLANLGDEAVGGVVVRVLGANGEALGSTAAGIPPYVSNLLVGVAELAGVTAPLDLFTVEVDAGGAAVHASASLVDNRTGDPVLVVEGPVGQPELVVPGVAHLPGALGSRWRTDVTLLNPGGEPLSCRLDYVPESPLPDEHGLDLTLGPRQAVMLEDVLGSLVGADAATKGFLRVRGTGGSAAPRVAARTYNVAADGTFGQRLEVYGADQLAAAGQTRAIAGVATGDPAGDGVGFRTNLGLTNASSSAPARLLVTLYAGPEGQVVGQIPYILAPAQFVQFDPFAAVGLGGDLNAFGSIEVRVDEGGPVAAYASVVDNATQDPILIPALPVE